METKCTISKWPIKTRKCFSFLLRKSKYLVPVSLDKTPVYTSSLTKKIIIGINFNYLQVGYFRICTWQCNTGEEFIKTLISEFHCFTYSAFVILIFFSFAIYKNKYLAFLIILCNKLNIEKLWYCKFLINIINIVTYTIRFSKWHSNFILHNLFTITLTDACKYNIIKFWQIMKTMKICKVLVVNR